MVILESVGSASIASPIRSSATNPPIWCIWPGD